MKAKITIDMENAAFDNSNTVELIRILQELCDKYLPGWSNIPAGSKHNLHDINGNVVGEFRTTRE